MEIGVCSFSFFRLFLTGTQDIFQYFAACKALGVTQLDHWDAHLAPLNAWEFGWKIWAEPDHVELMPQEETYLKKSERGCRGNRVAHWMHLCRWRTYL